MRVQNIQPTAFEKKQRFVTKEMYGTIRSLLTDMNKETVTNNNGYVYVSTITKELKYKDKIRFIDGRMYFSKLPENEQMRKESLITLGNAQLVVNNKTGEIIDFSKPLFKTQKSIMKSLETYLNVLKENYNNDNIVNKKYVSISGYTAKGEETRKLLKKI